MSLFEKRTSSAVVAGPVRPTGTGPVESRQAEEAPPDFADPGFGDHGWERPPNPTKAEAVPVYQVGADPGNLPYIEWDAFTVAVTDRPSAVGALNRRRRMLRVKNTGDTNPAVVKRNSTNNDSMGYTLLPKEIFESSATCEVWVTSALGTTVSVYAEYDVEEQEAE
jgi:hypothetical protein